MAQSATQSENRNDVQLVYGIAAGFPLLSSMLPVAFPSNFNYQIRVIPLGHSPKLVKLSAIELFFPLAMLNSSLLTLLLLFNLSSRPFVLIIGYYLLHQKDLFRRGRASAVKRSFNPQLVDAHLNEQPTRISTT